MRYKISSLQAKISLQGFQSCILSVRLFFEILPTAFWWLRFTFREKFVKENCFFGKIFNFLTFSDIELSFLSLLAKISRQTFQNCFLRVQRNILREISFGEKFVFFYQCSCIERESFGNLTKILGCGRQNGILRVRKKSLKTICFSERVVIFFIIFIQWAGSFFGSSGKKFSVELSKLHSTCPKEYVWEKLFSEKFKCILPYSDSERQLFSLLAKFPGWAFEKWVHVSIRTFWGGGILFEIFCNHLRHWAKKFCLFVKTFDRVVKTAFFLSIGNLCRLCF